MPRRPLFWIIFVALSIAAAVFTFKNFSAAFPLVAIDLQMDREAALRTARSLAESNSWPPDGWDQAAEFSADQEVQNFIELEGGGKPELGRILKEKIFAPYTWRVRHFKESDAHETLIRFTPEGSRYGFRIKLPEREKSDSKPAEEAQHIAEETARRDWNIDFSRYGLVEASKDVRPGGRTDHTFVYERQDERIREGRYRLRLVVGGSKLTELTHFVQVPEAFTRRYAQLRSANEAINAASTVAVFGVYILGFCGIGLFLMMRRHWVLWREATFWSFLIALLMGLQQLNSWPLLWMNYDTAVPASGFAIRQVMGALAIFGALAILLTISFMAAETLSRRAFPHHIQLWKVWSRPVASTQAVFGQTLSGYLLVAPFFAYEIVLYFFAQGKLGWWTPSDILVNPDMFANYLPSLSAIAQAAQAGFWEECLFRAAPLAAAALIGDRFGKRRLFIAAAMILQALVFASGHAGYANQPAYARLVELIIPSFAFGALYLVFGLLPGIILHFAYDTAWMALPLFVSSGTRAHIEQALVIAAVLVPLWVVLWNRTRSAKWSTVPEAALNAAWQPRESEEPPRVEAAPVVFAPSISPAVVRVLPAAGLIGLLVWLSASSFHTDAPSVRTTRAEAEQKARQALADRNIQIDSSWTVLGRAEGQPGEINRFVWQKAGRDRYQQLLGVYVTPPSWVIRFARFRGDVAERAEEYQVYVDGGGKVFRVNHDLPEARPGATLMENEARMIALSSLDGPGFEEVSAEASKKPGRTDWTFVFKDTRDYGLPEGEPRISVEIAGDQVVDSARYVYVPEEWSRNERRERNLPTIFSVICTIVVVAVVVGGAVVGVSHWSRKRPFSSRAFFAVLSVLFVSGSINAINSWPAVASQALTAQPLGLQIGIVTALAILAGLFTAAALALVAGLVERWTRTSSGPFRRDIVLGVSAGLALAGAIALARQAAPSTSPAWGNLAPASTFLPFIGAALGPLSSFFTQTLLFLTVLCALGRRPRWAYALWITVGIALTGSSSVETIPSWLIIGFSAGIALAIAYAVLFRHRPELLVITTATLVILPTLRDGFQQAYPFALPGSFAAAVLVAMAALVWLRLSGSEDSGRVPG